MLEPRNPVDLMFLYDTARGLVGLSRPVDAQRHVLLSLMGSCGAAFAAYLATDGAMLRVREARGVDPVRSRLDAKLTRRLRRALLDPPGVLTESELARLGPETRRLHEREIRLLAGVAHGGELLGAVALGPRLLGDAFETRERDLAAEVSGLAGEAIAACGSVSRPRRRRGAVTSRLRDLRALHPPLDAIVGDGPTTLALLEEIVAVSLFDLPVLVIGETGTGKELVARSIHALSSRSPQPFEAINCAAVPRDLLASALFGHERGAFTGAVSTARGVFERAGGGTVLLDEVGDMPVETQATLLRVLQERTFRRVGGEATLSAPARVISSTNVDLAAAVSEGRFRADLFYRIQMYAIRTLPLRERRDEIPSLVAHLLSREAIARPPVPSRAFLGELASRELRGNVRELEGLVMGALVRASGAHSLEIEHLPEAPVPATVGPVLGAGEERRADSGADVPSYRDMEREYVISVLRLTGGNKKDAAALMKIPRTTLNARIRKLGIHPAS